MSGTKKNIEDELRDQSESWLHGIINS